MAHGCGVIAVDPRRRLRAECKSCSGRRADGAGVEFAPGCWRNLRSFEVCHQELNLRAPLLQATKDRSRWDRTKNLFLVEAKVLGGWSVPVRQSACYPPAGSGEDGLAPVWVNG